MCVCVLSVVVCNAVLSILSEMLSNKLLTVVLRETTALLLKKSQLCQCMCLSMRVCVCV